MKLHEGRVAIILPYLPRGPAHLRFKEQWLTDHRSPASVPAFSFIHLLSISLRKLSFSPSPSKIGKGGSEDVHISGGKREGVIS